MSPESSSLRQALRDALPGAMKSKDTPARNAIRSALAAIENAEAVDQSHPTPMATGEQGATGEHMATGGQVAGEHVAGAQVGLGAGEADRLELDAEHILEIVTQERDERLAAAADYRRTGVIEQAERLEAEAAALDAFLC